MRFVTTKTSFILLVLALSPPLFALSVTPMTLDEMAQESASVIIAVAESIDTEAGNIALGPQTMVNMKVEELIWGYEVDTNLTFFLPEGSWTWNEEAPLFTDLPGVPKIVPGETYLLFLRTQDWLDSPFTGFDQGVYRLREMEGEVYPVSETGRCIVGVEDHFIKWGAAIAEHPTYWGPLFYGTRHYFTVESILELGPDPDDEGAGSYQSDERYVLDPALISQRLGGCLAIEEAIDNMNNILQNYSPSSRFRPITALDGPGYRNPVAYSPKPKQAADQVCFADINIPYSCEMLP